MGVYFSDFFSIFLNILRPNYFIFIGYLKTGAERGLSETPEPPLNPHVISCFTTKVQIFRRRFFVVCFSFFFCPKCFLFFVVVFFS